MADERERRSAVVNGSFTQRPVWRRRLLDGSSALLAVATLALPDFAAQDEPQPGYLRAYTIALVLWWLALAAVTAYLLWRGGKGQPTLARRRMRLLAGLGAGLEPGALAEIVSAP